MISGVAIKASQYYVTISGLACTGEIGYHLQLLGQVEYLWYTGMSQLGTITNLGGHRCLHVRATTQAPMITSLILAVAQRKMQLITTGTFGRA